MDDGTSLGAEAGDACVVQLIRADDEGDDGGPLATATPGVGTLAAA
jgi:hypothetical protein